MRIIGQRADGGNGVLGGALFNMDLVKTGITDKNMGGKYTEGTLSTQPDIFLSTALPRLTLCQLDGISLCIFRTSRSRHVRQNAEKLIRGWGVKLR